MLVIAIILAMVSLVWTAVIVRQGGLTLACLLVIAAGSCLGHPFFHVSVLTLDRVLFVALCGLYLIYRHFGQNEPKPLTLADVALAVLLGALLVSTFSHDWRVDRAQPASRYLLLYAMPAAMYWVARQSPLSIRQVNWIQLGFVGFAVYLSLTAIAEMTGQDWLIFPRYIVNSEFREFLGRGRGPFLNPVANGLYMTTGLACLMVAARPFKWRARTLLFITGLLIVAGTYATLTRCVWLGTILAILLLATIRLPTRRRSGVLVLTGCLGVATLAAAWPYFVAFKRDANLTATHTAESAKLRPMLAWVGWQMFLDHPLGGVGLGQYKYNDQEYIAARSIDWPLDRIRPYHQHNVVLSLMAETGLLGTLPFLVLLFCWSRLAWRLYNNSARRREFRQIGLVYLACLISYLTSGMFQDVALIPMTNLLLFFLAGLTTSAALKSELTYDTPRGETEDQPYPVDSRTKPVAIAN
jgi:hypothetical protein